MEQYQETVEDLEARPRRRRGGQLEVIKEILRGLKPGIYTSSDLLQIVNDELQRRGGQPTTKSVVGRAMKELGEEGALVFDKIRGVTYVVK